MKRTQIRRVNPWTICRPQSRDRGPRMPKPDGYSYLPFRRSAHLASLDYIENRGMYKEELTIERGKFPTYNRVLVIHTDGSMSEMEVEYEAPPFVVLYRDANSVFKSTRESLRKLEKEKGADQSGVAEENSSQEITESTIDMSAFPYCIPKTPSLGE